MGRKRKTRVNRRYRGRGENPTKAKGYREEGQRGEKRENVCGDRGVKGEAGRTERWALAHTRAIQKKFMYQKHKATAASSRP